MRGYGLIDSVKVKAEPGGVVNLKGVPAPNGGAAAQDYPAIYWYSMLKIPGKDQFGGKSEIPAKVTQEEWLNTMKSNGCVGCHQMGNLATRTIPKSLGEFKSSEHAGIRRVQSGQAGNNMVRPMPGFGVRGADIDSEGVIWVSLASGHLCSFDRRKCKGPLNGPKATGNHCTEGWSFHQFPGPRFKGLGENSAESSYYAWVDQHNTFGLGKDVPMATGNLNDGLIALKDSKMIVLRVPYPMGFFAKGFDGRIDDPNAGWKGRGLWTTSGDRAPWHTEGGKGNKPLVVQFQLRPSPIAK